MFKYIQLCMAKWNVENFIYFLFFLKFGLTNLFCDYDLYFVT